MKTLLIGVMLVAGIIFVSCVMLMSPKGGLGMGLAGMAGSSEYGSKKSLEHTLKRTAYVTVVLFVASSIALPYVD